MNPDSQHQKEDFRGLEDQNERKVMGWRGDEGPPGYPMTSPGNVSAVTLLVSPCSSGWGPLNHVYFQLANLFYFLSYLAPAGLHGLLYLRCTLMVGCAFTALWGATVLCSMDALLWNANFVVINLVHIIILLYRLRPVKFTKEVEEVYEAVFRPLKVTRPQFQKVLRCMKMIRQLKYHEVYAQEKVTKVDSLSLVLSGKLVVSQNGRALHIVFPHQFLDSPEWFGVSTDEYFQVSVTAMEESRVLLWHRDKLKLSIITDQFLQAVFDHILGRDVVKKLLQVSETMSATSLNGHLSSGYGSDDGAEDKPVVIVKKSGDGPGITALINRQLQAASEPDSMYIPLKAPNSSSRPPPPPPRSPRRYVRRKHQEFAEREPLLTSGSLTSHARIIQSRQVRMP